MSGLLFLAETTAAPLRPISSDGYTLMSISHPGSQDINPEALEEIEIELDTSDSESEQSEEYLDDPYLELFDRVNQLELEVKELTQKLKAFEQQRGYDLWVMRGMPVGGQAAGQANVGKTVFTETKPNSQWEFKFFE